jgi:hypothetical protein
MRNSQFPKRKGVIFCPGQEIKGLRGGVHRCAAQVSPKIDAAWAEKNLFLTETNYIDRQVLFAVFPLIKIDLRLFDTALGFLGSAFMLSYLLIAPLFG